MRCRPSRRGSTESTRIALYTAIAGAGLGYFLSAVPRSRAHRLTVAIGLFVLAMVAHRLLDASLALGTAAIPLSGAVSLIGVRLVWRFSDRGEREWVRTLLAPEVTRGVVVPAELDAITGRRKTLERYVKNVRHQQGRQAGRNAKNLLHAQIELAADLAATGSETSPEVVRLREAMTAGRGV